MNMKLLVLLAAYATVALCQEETRHSKFYGRYRPAFRPSFYYYGKPISYRPSYSKTFYLAESCCSDTNLQAAGCIVVNSIYVLNFCKCCIRDQNSQALINAVQTCTGVTAATTIAPTIAPTSPATITAAITTAATPAAATTTVSTTTVSTKSCPNSGCSNRRRRAAYGFFNTLRIEGGTSVTNICDYPGAVAIEATAPGGQVITVCTGALMSSTTIQIPSNCADTLALAGATNDQAVINGVKVPISSISSDKPLAIVTLSSAVDITQAPTQACIYTKSMGTYDKSTCEIVGFGVNAANVNQATAQTASVTFNALGCNGVDTSLTIPEATYGCATLSNAAACAGDGGALITCDLDSTGEKVVIGQAETFDCDTAQPAVYFQNFDV